MKYILIACLLLAGCATSPQTLSIEQPDQLPLLRDSLQPRYPANRVFLAFRPDNSSYYVWAPAEVLVEFIVTNEGRVILPKVIQSSDHAFDEAALHAVYNWKFEPGRLQGRTINCKMVQPVIFKGGKDA